VNKTIDGMPDTDVNKGSCFVSADERASFAEYTFKRYELETVRLLNRGDNRAERLNGVTVYACMGDACTLCGTVSNAGEGTWSEVFCFGLIANRVKVVAPSLPDSYLTICEIEITGFEVHIPEVPIKSVKSSEPSEERWSSDKTIDGDTGTNVDGAECFVSGSDEAFVQWGFRRSAIETVAFLNRGDSLGNILRIHIMEF
jgi:hypothetical protein